MSLISVSKNSISYQVSKKVFVSLAGALLLILCILSFFQFISIESEERKSFKVWGDAFKNKVQKDLENKEPIEKLNANEDYLISSGLIAGIVIFDKNNNLVLLKGDLPKLSKIELKKWNEKQSFSKKLYSLSIPLFSKNGDSKLGEIILYGHQGKIVEKWKSRIFQMFLYTLFIALIFCIIVYSSILSILVRPLLELTEKIEAKILERGVPTGFQKNKLPPKSYLIDFLKTVALDESLGTKRGCRAPINAKLGQN